MAEEKESLNKSKKSNRLSSKKEEKVELYIDKTWNYHTIDLIVHYQQKLNDAPKIIKSVGVYFNERNQIVSYLLADYLKNNEYCREDSTISLWDKFRNTYVFGFNITRDVINITKNIAKSFVNENQMVIKVRGRRKLIVQSLIQEQRLKYQQDDSNKNKQKKIGQVVQKVALWRKFYTGFYDQFGNYIQKPLEAAAQEVGIAKKTLDDYLLQIRNGKKYGFNFNDKVNAKIGELRAFVRDQKKKEQTK